MSIPHSSDNIFPMTPLSTKVVRGGIWVFALRMTNRGLGLVRTIVLARLLSPEDFGLFGIAMLAIATLETFSQTGFQPALIQKKENVDQYLDTAWTATAVRGIILFLVLFVTAPLVADFFKAPKTTQIIRIIAITTLLSGFRNIGILFFQRELAFRRLFAYEFPATLTDLGVSVTLAFLLRDVRALIYGGLAAGVVRLLLSYGIHPFRPRFRIEREKFQELFGFGKWVLGSGILIFVITQGDDVFVGRLLGVTALGLYQMAYTFSNLPATEICHVISQVTFPAYSKFQDDIPRLRKAFLRVFHFTAFLSIPLAAGILIMAPDFTRVFLGEKWTLMIPAFQILAFWGIIRSLGATVGPVFQSIGRPEVLTKLQILVLLLLCIFIYPFSVKWGIQGTSLAVVLSTFLPNVAATFLALKLINCKGIVPLKSLCWSLANTGIMVASMLIAKNYLISSIGMTQFVFIIILGASIYFGTSYAFRNLFLNHKEAIEFIIQRI